MFSLWKVLTMTICPAKYKSKRRKKERNKISKLCTPFFPLLLGEVRFLKSMK